MTATVGTTTTMTDHHACRIEYSLARDARGDDDDDDVEQRCLNTYTQNDSMNI